MEWASQHHRKTRIFSKLQVHKKVKYRRNSPEWNQEIYIPPYFNSSIPTPNVFVPQKFFNSCHKFLFFLPIIADELHWSKKKISLLTHKKTQPSSQPHAGFLESNYAISAQFLAHAQTFDRGVSITKPRTHASNRVSLVVTYHGCKFVIPKIVLHSVQSTRCVENYS